MSNDQNSLSKQVHSLIKIIAGIFLFTMALGALLPKGVPAVVALIPSAIGWVNVIIHETGHMVFGLLGYGIGVAGGTLAQLLAPLAVSFSALRQRMPIAIAVCVVWLGQNFIQISPYIADARERKVDFFQWWAAFGGPIMETGSKTHHDWYIMLNAVHLLWADKLIATLFFIVGAFLMFGAIACLVAPSAWREKVLNLIAKNCLSVGTYRRDR
ncbi:hypothetical protein OAO01_03645 [Oligoflexia bacterium]|nr:hypothetical protein [Oligoflexia bacterium]